MYKYDFLDEVVIYEKTSTFIEINEQEFFASILITDKNLLIFKNINNDFLKQKASGVFVTPEYELIKKISLDNIKYNCEDGNTFFKEYNLVLYDINLNKVLKKISYMLKYKNKGGFNNGNIFKCCRLF